jgi:hypothetical protein
LHLRFQKKRAEKKSRDTINFLDKPFGFEYIKKAPNLRVFRGWVSYLRRKTKNNPLKEETVSIELTIDSVSFLIRSLSEQNYLNFTRSSPENGTEY